MVKFENREIWADLENRSKVVHSENFPIWRPASGHRDHVTHHVTSHVTHWGQWKYASRSWHAVGNHRRQLKLMYRSKISGRGPKHCCRSKFQCHPRPDNCNPGGHVGLPQGCKPIHWNPNTFLEKKVCWQIAQKLQKTSVANFTFLFWTLYFASRTKNKLKQLSSGVRWSIT